MTITQFVALWLIIGLISCIFIIISWYNDGKNVIVADVLPFLLLISVGPISCLISIIEIIMSNRHVVLIKAKSKKRKDI